MIFFFINGCVNAKAVYKTCPMRSCGGVEHKSKVNKQKYLFVCYYYYFFRTAAQSDYKMSTAFPPPLVSVMCSN